jgi:hypothetical protein
MEIIAKPREYCSRQKRTIRELDISLRSMQYGE